MSRRARRQTRSDPTELVEGWPWAVCRTLCPYGRRNVHNDLPSSPPVDKEHLTILSPKL